MKIPDDMKTIPIMCFRNGRRTILPFEEVYHLFWTVILGWVLLSDFFRTGSIKHANQGRFSQTVQGDALKFVFNILTRGSLALAREDQCFLDEHDEPPGRGIFAVWAHRFGKLFNGYKPYERVFFTDRDGHRQPGYRMKQGETWLVVVEVDPDSGFKNEDLDWTIFETPPKKQKKLARQSTTVK